MKSDKDAYTRLDNALKRAFRDKEKAKPSEDWQQNVMRHIRSLEPHSVTTNCLDLFEQFVWRFAPVACVLILVLAICIINLGLVPEYEVVKLFVKDPIEFSYVQMFGV
jgi:hypothetical protein